MAKGPKGVLTVAASVTMSVTGVPVKQSLVAAETSTLLEASEGFGDPLGTVGERATVPVKPLTLHTLIVTVPGIPELPLILPTSAEGDAYMQALAGLAAVTVTIRGAEDDSDPMAAVMKSLYVPAGVQACTDTNIC